MKKGFFVDNDFERERYCAAAPLLSATRSGLVCEEELNGGQKEGAEAAAFGVGEVEVLTAEDTGKEVLSQVLRFFARVPLTANIDVNGIPVSGTKGFEGVAALLLVLGASCEQESPAGGREFTRTDWGGWGSLGVVYQLEARGGRFDGRGL